MIVGVVVFVVTHVCCCGGKDNVEKNESGLSVELGW